MTSLTETKYQSNVGRIHAFALSPRLAAVAGTAPTGAVTDSLRPKISKTRREYGLKPRGVKLSRTFGVAPDTFKRYIYLPVLTSTAFASTAFALGSEITIDSVTWVVVSQFSEEYN